MFKYLNISEKKRFVEKFKLLNVFHFIHCIQSQTRLNVFNQKLEKTLTQTETKAKFSFFLFCSDFHRLELEAY